MSENKENLTRFKSIGFEDFKELAQNEGLSPSEKIGFPDSYRDGFDAGIFHDICTKLPALNEQGKTILDIGPGCGTLAQILLRHCKAQGHTLDLIDSAEMLELLETDIGVTKVSGAFPQECASYIQTRSGQVDAILVYSVFHYIFVEGNIHNFIDEALALLAPGGRLLIGDIPNSSMRKRFFESDTGKAFHKEFMKTDQDPRMSYNQLEAGEIDDAILVGLMQRYRAMGFHVYLSPQGADLPMANRREDLVIIKI